MRPLVLLCVLASSCRAPSLGSFDEVDQGASTSSTSSSSGDQPAESGVQTVTGLQPDAGAGGSGSGSSGGSELPPAILEVDLAPNPIEHNGPIAVQPLPDTEPAMHRPLTDTQRDSLHTIWTLCRANGGSTRLDDLADKARSLVARGLVRRLSGTGLARWSMTPAGTATHAGDVLDFVRTSIEVESVWSERAGDGCYREWREIMLPAVLRRLTLRKRCDAAVWTVITTNELTLDALCQRFERLTECAVWADCPREGFRGSRRKDVLQRRAAAGGAR